MKDLATFAGYPAAGLAVMLLTSCATSFTGNLSHRETPRSAAPVPTGQTQRGLASFYRVRTNGRTTASGIPFSDHKYTAAHRNLPFGTLVRVTNKRNGRSRIVQITDRGPFIRGRIIDVSLAVAKELDMVNSGIVPCEIEVLNPPNRA